MKITKRIVAILLILLLTIACSACGGGDGGSSGVKTVQFMYGGSVSNTDLAEMYNLAIEQFNKTVGKEKRIKVKGVPKGTSLKTVLAQQLPNDTAADIIGVDDECFKRYANYFADLSGVLDEQALSSIYPNMISRYHYNLETTTSNSGDPLYAVPVYNDISVFFYNKTILGKNGVICISVDADKLADFNAGGKDLNGKTKADYGIKVNVPARGFFRSVSPFVPGKGETDGISWIKPESDEVLIFNDRIPMNWDELEDLAMLCTKEKNNNSASRYGYYTEWWFNHGWTVGGDCLEDLSGKGDWTYTLPSDTSNYIVNAGKTYTGVYTGTTYQAGETLDFKDVLNAKQGDNISWETDKKSSYNFTVNGAKATERDFSAEVANGTLSKLPSIRTAFSRFCYLAAQGGLNVCPYPSAFSGTTAVQYFASGSIAMLLEYGSNFKSLDKIMKDEWSIAPYPQYKEYTDPGDPQCDTVKVAGKSAGHSMGYAIGIKKTSKMMNEASEFVKWFATDGQKFLAEQGYVSTREQDSDLFTKNTTYKNPEVILNDLEVAAPGDWWYLLDNEWIRGWSGTLNNEVRYGKVSLQHFLYSYIDATNELLKKYK